MQPLPSAPRCDSGDVAASASPDFDAPLFVVGAERSGTTLLRLMLDHHPAIACHFEFEFAVEMVSDEGQVPPLDDFYEYLSNDRIFLHSGATIDRDLPYDLLVRSFLRQKVGERSVQQVGATVHKNFDRLRHLWPRARYIYLLRDGRDVARSVVKMGWEGNPYCGCERWAVAERTWADLKRELTADQCLEVRYEALVAEPTQTLGDICRFLGLAYDPAMLDYAEHSTYGIPDARFAGQWRSMSRRELRLVESRIGGQLESRGYPLSGPPRHDVGPPRRAWLRLHSRWGRFRFRMRRYGLGLVAADALLRRCGSQAQRGRIQRRLHEIDAGHVR